MKRKRNGHRPLTREEKRHKCPKQSKEKVKFSNPELISVVDNRNVYQSVCLGCGFVLEVIAGGEWKRNPYLSHHLSERLAKKKDELKKDEPQEAKVIK